MKRSKGILFNQSIHNLQILGSLVPLKIDRIATITKNTRGKNAADAIDDILFAIVRFKNGVIANIEVNISSIDNNVESSLFVTGSKGCIKIGGKSLNEIRFNSCSSEVNINEEQRDLGLYGGGHISLIHDLSDFLLGNSQQIPPNLTKPGQIVELIKFMNEIYKAEI